MLVFKFLIAWLKKPNQFILISRFLVLVIDMLSTSEKCLFVQSFLPILLNLPCNAVVRLLVCLWYCYGLGQQAAQQHTAACLLPLQQDEGEN